MNRPSWSLLALLFLLPTAALAVPGDADDDGVSDEADAFPNDWRRSGISYVPGDGLFSTLMFEDNWPAAGDLDFNDAVVAYSIAVFHGIDGRASGLRLTVVPRAIGANLSSGLALRLPVPAETSFTGTRQIGNGAPEAITADAGESQLVLTVVDALRPLFGDAPGFINTDPTVPASANGEPVVVELFFQQSIDGLDVQSDPFDLYFFRTGDPSHQVHRPQFGGTDRMNNALFRTRDDASTDGRYFVDRQGLPFVLSIPDATAWPAERRRVDEAWPNIVDFAESDGASATDYWLTARRLDKLFTGGGPVSGPGIDHGVHVGPSCTDGVRNGTETDVDCGGSCGPCTDGRACRTHADCMGQLCENNVCVRPEVRACAVANGVGQEVRTGAGWSTCTPTSCNAGYVLSNGSCTTGPSCVDGVQNGNESGVDCGGSFCAPCPSCYDGIQNQGESGVDCGGRTLCPACPPPTSSCYDGVQNGSESGVDCGGPVCPACPPPATCNDGVRNRDETAVDCGGFYCNPCPPPTTCSCSDGVQNCGETGVDCGGTCGACCAPNSWWTGNAALCCSGYVNSGGSCEPAPSGGGSSGSSGGSGGGSSPPCWTYVNATHEPPETWFASVMGGGSPPGGSVGVGNIGTLIRHLNEYSLTTTNQLRGSPIAVNQWGQADWMDPNLLAGLQANCQALCGTACPQLTQYYAAGANYHNQCGYTIFVPCD